MTADDIRKIVGHLEQASAVCDGTVPTGWAEYDMFDKLADATRAAQEALGRKERSSAKV